jgi:hypothetical protein
VLLLVDSSLVWIDHQALWKSTYFCTFAFSKRVQELSVLLIDNFDMVQILPQFIARAKAIYCDLGFLNPIVGELPQFQEAIQQGKVRSLNKYSQLVRWVKSSAELELMHQAAAITSKVCLGCHPSCVSFCSYWPLVLRSSKYLWMWIRIDCLDRGNCIPCLPWLNYACLFLMSKQWHAQCPLQIWEYVF